MNYLTDKSMQVYHAIKTGKRRQYATPVSRESIGIYQKGFEAGFTRGFEAGLKMKTK